MCGVYLCLLIVCVCVVDSAGKTEDWILHSEGHSGGRGDHL